MAFEGWLHKQDYRFIERLLEAMRNETDAAEMSRQYQEALDGSQEALRACLAETNAAMEQAVVDGIIVEEKRSEYSAKVVAMHPKDILYLPHGMRNWTRCVMISWPHTKTASAELHEEWRELEKRLMGSRIEPGRQEEICAFMSAALTREDTRVIEECIAHLMKMFDVGSDGEKDWFRAPPTRDVLAEFTRLAPGIERWLEQPQGLETIVKDIRQGLTQADLRFAQVPEHRLEETVNAITAWRRLKQQRPRNLESTVALATILRYLGFDLEPGAVRIEPRRGEDWVHARVTMSVSDFLVKPIPQFGSQAQGRYDVICLWERPRGRSHRGPFAGVAVNLAQCNHGVSGSLNTAAKTRYNPHVS